MNTLIENFSEIHKNELTTKEGYLVQRSWLEIFSASVKEKTGAYVYKGFPWHCFSYEFYPCTRGEKALTKYAHQEIETYYVFDENCSVCWRCESQSYPDLRLAGFDEAYVFPLSKNWTMVFSHYDLFFAIS